MQARPADCVFFTTLSYTYHRLGQNCVFTLGEPFDLAQISKNLTAASVYDETMSKYETRLWINGEYAKPELGKTYPLYVCTAAEILDVARY